MFGGKTVFILGAGASVTYGYPTGDGLIRDVLRLTSEVAGRCAKYSNPNNVFADLPEWMRPSRGSYNATYAHQKWTDLKDQCELLRGKLINQRPTVIDYFLGHNSDVRETGKLLTALSLVSFGTAHRDLLGRVFRGEYQPGDNWYGDDWYRFVFEHLLRGCSDTEEMCAKNDVTFVTFNYDTSIELELYRRLVDTDVCKDRQKVKGYLRDHVIHVYGALRPFDSFEPETRDSYLRAKGAKQSTSREDWILRLENAHDCAHNIHTIAPAEKVGRKVDLERAQKAIAAADTVYILGYGFDPSNNANIELANGLTAGPSKRVFITNYQDNARVEKCIADLKAETATFARHRQKTEKLIDPPRISFQESGDSVVGALAGDFAFA